jgi:hypothetical protein
VGLALVDRTFTTAGISGADGFGVMGSARAGGWIRMASLCGCATDVLLKSFSGEALESGGHIGRRSVYNRRRSPIQSSVALSPDSTASALPIAAQHTAMIQKTERNITPFVLDIQRWPRANEADEPNQHEQFATGHIISPSACFPVSLAPQVRQSLCSPKNHRCPDPLYMIVEHIRGYL